jgi:hypothetical protein
MHQSHGGPWQQRPLQTQLSCGKHPSCDDHHATGQLSDVIRRFSQTLARSLCHDECSALCCCLPASEESEAMEKCEQKRVEDS